MAQMRVTGDMATCDIVLLLSLLLRIWSFTAVHCG